jgi:hypothetical protein
MSSDGSEVDQELLDHTIQRVTDRELASRIQNSYEQDRRAVRRQAC